MEILLSFLAGGLITGFIFWWKNRPVTRQLQEAQQQIGRAEELTRTNSELKTQNEALNAQLLTAQTEKAQLAEREKALKEKQTEQTEFINRLWQEQEKKFQEHEENFRIKNELAFKEITETQKAALTTKNSELYTPLKESFEQFTKQVNDLRAESTSRHTLLQNTLERTMQLNETLSQEAQNLINALKNTKKQGDWGEIILEDVLTTAGLREGIEFEKQTGLRDEENKLLKPDFIIHLPNRRDLIIDAKMSLTAYVKWANEPDGPQKQKYLEEHIASVEAHIKELSEKDYPKVLKNEKLDFTFMFIPIEYAYFAALSGRSELNEFARRHRIVIATASNLFCLLQLVENLWRIERSTQTIDQIYKVAQEMHNRVGLFTERMEEIHTQSTAAGIKQHI